MNLKYWKDINDSHLKYDGSSGNLISSLWVGGINNIRMSLEMSFCMAYLTNRTLVIPRVIEFWEMGDIKLSDMFDFGYIKIKYLDDYLTENNLEDWTAPNRTFDFDKDKLPDNIFYYDVIPYELHGNLLSETDLEQIDHRPVLMIDTICPSNEFNVFFNESLFGIYYLIYKTNRMSELKTLINKHVRYKDSVIQTAKECIDNIGNEYYSIHSRRHRFQYDETLISINEIISKIKNEIPNGSTLYISSDFEKTDEKESFIKKLSELYHVICWQDFNIETNQYTPMVEQIICSRGIKFISHFPSTFSSYIFRIRGLMGDVNSRFYDIIQDNDMDDTNSMRHNIGNLCVFGREYRDAWEYNL